MLIIDLAVVAVRTSLLYVRLPYLLDMQDKRPRAVDRTVQLLEKPRLRASLRLSVGIAHFLLVTTCWLVFTHLADLAIPGALLAFGGTLLVALIILALEFILEGLILRDIESWALRLASLGQLIDIIFLPLSGVFMNLLGLKALERIKEPFIEDELRNWVKNGMSGGVLETEERKMIYSIFQFGDTLCREIMVPRIDVNALEADTSIPEAIEAVIESGHSRVPVFDDTIDNIIGLLYVKDLLRVPLEHDGNHSIHDLLRAAYFVPEAKKVPELLREMQTREVHMVIVVDEFGGTAGLVTLEDVVEEIVGEIRDEYDQGEELLHEKTGADEYIFHGRIDLDDFNDLVETNLPKDMADTLGGFIYGQIGRVPVEGEQVNIDGWVLTVTQVSNRRIVKVRAERRQILLEDEEMENDTERRQTQ